MNLESTILDVTLILPKCPKVLKNECLGLQKKKKCKSGKIWHFQNEPWICHLGCHLGFNKIPQSDIIIFYSIYRWWNVHKGGILWIVKHGDGQIRNWHIFGSHLRCPVEFLEKPKGDKVASISFFKERSLAIKTIKTFCIYRQSRFTKIMFIIWLLVIPAGLIIKIVKEMFSWGGGGHCKAPHPPHTPCTWGDNIKKGYVGVENNESKRSWLLPNYY